MEDGVSGATHTLMRKSSLRQRISLLSCADEVRQMKYQRSAGE